MHEQTATGPMAGLMVLGVMLLGLAAADGSATFVWAVVGILAGLMTLWATSTGAGR